MENGKAVIVTGGERGVGRGIAERFLAEGWKVALWGIDEQAAAAFLGSVGDASRIRFWKVDVSDYAGLQACLSAFEQWSGRLDALVANAGLASPERLPLEELPLEAWQRVIDVNLSGLLYCAKVAVPLLRASGGSLLSIGSTRASMSEANTFAYTASKGGVVALTHCLAASLGPEVRVNCISPGWIHAGPADELTAEDHAQHWAGRVGEPRDIAGLAYFLCSEDAGFITGQEFVVDGGMTKKMIYC